ncbi:MAG: N-methyl-L-tryptophan oxidase [Synechococcales cyanobacterium C42_A2020_086]|jgi:sarcosine oxidase|nr:N-methyl-L-tryptophan oxidase [Synechococcales cyanobacterium C42_A2020_086]
MTSSYDAIVIGLGGMGSATAYQLAQRGKRVLGIEQFTSPHERGSSHGKSRIIRQAYFEHPAYVPLLQRAYELWQQIEHDTQQSLLTLTGGLMLGPPESATVAGSLHSAQQHDLPHEVWDAAEIHRRVPPLCPPPGTVALYERKAGILRPEVSIAAHLQRAAQLGADLHFQEPVLDWRTMDSGVEVTTAQGQYHAERLVITPGPWASHLLKLDLPLVVERQVLYWFQPTTGIEPFLSDRLPIYIWETEDGVQFYGFPAHDSLHDGAKIAFFRMGQVCTPDTIDRTVYDSEIAKMRHYIDIYIPTLNGILLNTATCMYTNTPDTQFVIGLHPIYPQVVIASPCSGHGFKFASVVGEILADLALSGTTLHPLDLFAPDRFQGTRG